MSPGAETDLPEYPGTFAADRPFDPPSSDPFWRPEGGLRQALWNGVPVWVVSRHEDVAFAMTHPAISANVRGPLLAKGLTGDEEMPATFPRMDDPEHSRMRKMLVREFTAKRSESLRGQVREMAQDFADELVAKGPPADLVEGYALPLPSLVISTLLGVPYEDREFFQEHSATGFRLSATQEEHLDAIMSLLGYMSELVERRRVDPADDLMSRLVTDHVVPGDLAPDAAAMNGMILLNAGHETTANMIALGLLALLQRPELAERIRASEDPAEITRAVDELMRYLSIVQGLVTRIAAADVEIGGQLVRAGEGLIMNLPAANRDPRRFPDPDTLDLDRDARGHLAFGHGVHVCLGQTLARVEMEEAIPVLLRRLPDLRLAIPASAVDFRGGMSTYGVHALPVTW